MDISIACTTKIKEIVGDKQFEEFQIAIDNNDEAGFNKLLTAENEKLSKSRKDAARNAMIRAEILDYLKERMDNTKVKDSWSQRKKNKARHQEGVKALGDMLSGSRQRAGIVNTERSIFRLQGKYVAPFAEELRLTKPKKAGISREGGKNRARSIARAAFKETFDDDAAKHIADKWSKLRAKMNLDYENAGGDPREVSHQVLKTTHYSPKLLKVGEDEWVSDVKRLYKLSSRATRLRGKKPLTEAQLDEVTRIAYREITGERTLEEAIAEGKGTLTGMLDDLPSFEDFVPRGGDQWMEYNTKYGLHNHPMDAMVDQINEMATRTTLLRDWGTDPRKMIEDIVTGFRDIAEDKKIGQAVLGRMNQITSTESPTGSNVTNTLRGFRHYQTITLLGSAPVAAMTDTSFMTMTALYNDMSPIKLLSRHMKMLLTGDADSMEFATKLGMHSEWAVANAASLSRLNESIGFGKLAKLADITVRATGLNHWTNSARTAFYLEFLATLGSMSDQSFGDMSKGVRKGFERVGIVGADWDVIRKAIVKEKGIKYIDATQIKDDKIAAKVIGLVKEEASFAVPETTIKSRAMIDFNQMPNTIESELVRTGMQFKSFPVAILASHMGRMLDQTSLTSKATYGASMVVGASIMGSAVLWSRDILNGRDPRQIDTAFIRDSIIQGGGLSILGDIFLSDPDLFGGFTGFLAGPTAGSMQKILSYLWDIGDKAVADDFATAWYEEAVPGAVKGGEKALAFAGNLWYTKLLYQQLISKHIHELADPNHYEKQRQKDNWYQENRGQGNWFQEERLPELPLNTFMD